MPPLSQALSSTSASGAVHQSKALDSPQQWTPPNNGPSNILPLDSNHPQAPATSERKPSAHKQARKVEDSGADTRQNLERDSEPARPQHELSAGVVDNGILAERSSTASNTDGRATRSASTASEVFSHQSSRPSTNNTSRSSASPAAGNSKTISHHVSSITTSSSPAVNLRAKLDTPSISSATTQQANAELPSPSISAIPTPSAVRSQDTGLNRRISYMTDVGNTKESLTNKLKFKLYRCKTDTRYLDSFGDNNLPQVDGLRQWELSGTAKSKWEDILKPAIVLTMKDNHTAIYGNQLEVRYPRLECTMIGKTAQQANPLIRVTHKKKSVCERLAKLSEKLDVVKQSGFWVTHRQAQNFRANWELTGSPPVHFEAEMSLVPLSGAELVVAEGQKRSTIGAVIDVDGRRYGLTVAHVFNDEDSNSPEDEECDNGSYPDADGSEEWASEYDEEEFNAWLAVEDSSTESKDPAPTSEDRPLIADDEAGKGLLWKCQLTTDTGPEYSAAGEQFDWALMKLGEYEYRATNDSLSPFRTPTFAGVLTRVSSLPPILDRKLLVVTPRGILRAVGRESPSKNEWPIQLTHGEFELGDSGSLIVDAIDDSVYGILISGDPLFGNGYMAPAIEIHDDLQRTIRADLQYGEETRQMWPSRQFDAPILPAQYEMLPSRFKVLLDAARAGDFWSISRLIDSDSMQPNHETEQKKPLVEAAKRYKPLTPIADIINTKMNMNEDGAESSVRQLAEFYRNAARNAFRGEVADLGARRSFLRILLTRGVDPKESADIEGTALHQAAEDGNLKIVEELVAEPEDTAYVNLRRHNCWSPLHLAVREGHADVVEFLMANGGDVAALSGSEDTRQDTILQIAAWKGNSSVVRILLDQKAISTSDNGRFGGPIRAAALSASRLYNEAVSRLEQNEPSKLSYATHDEEHTERVAKEKLFAIAKRYQQPVTESSLLKADSKLPSDTLTSRSIVLPAVLQPILNVVIQFADSALARTKLPTMLASGSTIFELLLANEASHLFKATEKDLEQAFFIAAEEGPSLLVGIFEHVLNRTLAPKLMRVKRSKALCLAASAGGLLAVDILLRKGVDIDFKDDDGWTALQLAADAGHLKIVQRLCQQKADVDKQGPAQQTAVTCAAGSLKPDATSILEFLLKMRADAKVKTKKRGNAVNIAARLGYKQAVEILLGAGVNAEIRTPRDGTPLQVAAIRNYTEVVQILLKHLDSKDAEEYLQEAMWSAAIYGSFDTVKILLEEHPNLQIQEKLLSKVVRSSWVTGGVVDILQKRRPRKGMQARLRLLYKAAKNWRHPTFALPLHPYSAETACASSVAACLLQYEDDHSLAVPEEIFLALAEKSDEATIALLMKKSRELLTTDKVLAAAASNAFHGDKVLPLLLPKPPNAFGTWSQHQSMTIMKAAVGNRELGVSMLEIVLQWIPSDTLQIEDCIFEEAAANPFHGKELVERLFLRLPVDRRLIVSPKIVQTAAENWSSGDLVLQALLESESTTFTQEAAAEVILGFTGAIRDMDLEQYEIDVLGLLLKRKDVTVTPDLLALVIKRADRKTVEMFEKELSKSTEISDVEIERQIVAAASNVDHAPEIVTYLLEKTKGITLSERLLDIAAEKEEENEPNIAGNLILTAFFKSSNAVIHLDDFENLLDDVVRDFNFDTVQALLSRHDLKLKVTRFTLEQAVQNLHATQELLKLLLEYTGKPSLGSNTPDEPAPRTSSESTVPTLVASSDKAIECLPIAAVLACGEVNLQKQSDVQADAEEATSLLTVQITTDKPSRPDVTPLEPRVATSEALAPEVQVSITSDAVKSPTGVDWRVDQFVMLSAAKNVDRGRDLIEVLLDYCDVTAITERVLRAAVTNRKQALEIVGLLQNYVEHSASSTSSPEASPVTPEESEIPEKVKIKANTTFWKPRITRRIFQAAMRNWTEGGNNVLLQLLKNDLTDTLTQDMVLEIIRQHKLRVVKELFANHGASFPITDDTAEDLFAAAGANWDAGVKVFRFIIDGNKSLAAKIIPQSEKIAEAVTGNWKSGKLVLDLLLRRYRLCVTERVLVATARNPSAGADIMKVLLRSYTGRISVDILRAAAENFKSGAPLLKVLLKRGGYTRIPDEVLSAIAGNGSCGPEILDLLVDGNYAFTLTESTLLSCVRNNAATRVFMVSPVSPGREVKMTADLLLQQRDKFKNGNQLLKPPLHYGGIVCLMNMYASRWQECNVLWGLKNGISEDETWVRREDDWVWGTGRGILLDLLENHWADGDFVPDSVLDIAAKSFDAEVVRALLKKRDKPITERVLLNATSNDLYAHEVVIALLAEKRLLPPDSITWSILESAARNTECGRQLLECLWTEKSKITEGLLDAAVDNASQGEQIITFLLEKGAKITTDLVEYSIGSDTEGSTAKLLLDHCDDKEMAFTGQAITNAAGNEARGSEILEEFLKMHPTIEIPDTALVAAARNPGCGAKVMKLLMKHKPLSEVKNIDDILVPAAGNPEQAIRLLSILLEENQCASPAVWRAAVENPEIAFEVVAFLVDRKNPGSIPEDLLLSAVAEPDIPVELLELLRRQNGEFEITEALFQAAIRNWKSGFEVLQWMKNMHHVEHNIQYALEGAVSNVGCGIEILNYLLSEYEPPRYMLPLVWNGAASNLGCGHILISRLLQYCDNQVNLTDGLLLKSAAENLNWSVQIFKAFSDILILPDSPARIPYLPERISEQVILSLVNNWKSGENTIRFLKSSSRWTLATTDVLLQMIAQNTPETEGALAILLDEVEEFEFPEMPDAVSPFWLVRSLKAIELLVTKCKRSSLPQDLVKKIVGGWRADAIARIMDGTEITQEVFLNSATNVLNDGYITKMLHKANPELVVTDEMLQKAVGNNIDLTKTILEMGQKVSKKTLGVAVKQDNARILNVLLATVGDMKIPDSILEAAITNGSPRIVEILLQHGLEDRISEDSLCNAVSKDGNLEIMKTLLAHIKGDGSTKIDILPAILDEAIDQSCLSMIKLLLEHNVAVPFPEHTWAKAVAQNDLDIIQLLLKHDPHLQVTDHILKCAVKASNVEAAKLLLAHDPQVRITQNVMERAAKCRGVEMLKLLTGHIQDKEAFKITDRFLESVASNSLEVVLFVLEQWPTIRITEDIFGYAAAEGESKVLDTFLEKFPDFRLSTHLLVDAAKHTDVENFKKILERAKEQSLQPTDEVLEALIERSSPPPPPPPPGGLPGQTPRLEMVRLVLDANKDCLTENALQSALRADNVDIAAFKFLFQQRQWPQGLVQSEFRNLMRQRPSGAKVMFLLDQEGYDLKITPGTFVNAAEHFDELALQALVSSPRIKDCAISADLLGTILRGTVGYAIAPGNPRPPWQYNKIDTSVFQKVKVLLEFREVEVTLRNIIQAQDLGRAGQQIIQLFLDTPNKAKMTEDVRKYAESLYVVKELTFKPKSARGDTNDQDAQEEQFRVPESGYPSGPPSEYSDDDDDSASSYSSSSDGAAHSLDTLDESDKRSRENEHPVTYSLPFDSYKSGVAVELAWAFQEPAVIVDGV